MVAEACPSRLVLTRDVGNIPERGRSNVIVLGVSPDSTTFVSTLRRCT